MTSFCASHVIQPYAASRVRYGSHLDTNPDLDVPWQRVLSPGSLPISAYCSLMQALKEARWHRAPSNCPTTKNGHQFFWSLAR